MEGKPAHWFCGAVPRVPWTGKGIAAKGRGKTSEPIMGGAYNSLDWSGAALHNLHRASGFQILMREWTGQAWGPDKSPGLES